MLTQILYTDSYVGSMVQLLESSDEYRPSACSICWCVFALHGSHSLVVRYSSNEFEGSEPLKETTSERIQSHKSVVQCCPIWSPLYGSQDLTVVSNDAETSCWQATKYTSNVTCMKKLGVIGASNFRMGCQYFNAHLKQSFFEQLVVLGNRFIRLLAPLFV